MKKTHPGINRATISMGGDVMKVLLIDWLANTNPWASGFVVMNRGHKPSPVQVSIGSKITRPVIAPWEILTQYPSPGTNSSAVIVGSDKISIFATTRLSWNSCFAVPVYEAKTLGEAIYPFADINHEWQSTPFWTALKGTGNPARYNRALQMAAVQMAAMQIYFEFPDRKDRALGVMDACPLTGDAPGHPLGAHSSNGTALDVSYYTMNANNTQVGQNPEIIFTGGALNQNFDLKRNARVFQLISQYLPASLTMVDERIARALGFPSYLQGDSVPSYKHDQHAHIVLGGRINEDALL